MDCELFMAGLGEWLDGACDQASARGRADHAAQCRACATALAQEREVRAALRSLPVPPVRPEFARDALRVAVMADRATRRHLRQHYRRIAWALGSMAAAALVTVLVLRPFQDSGENELAMSGGETWALMAGQVQSLRLRIDAPRDFDGVRFSVDLPDHVSLAGQPGIRSMTWEGSLRKGTNVLELPLVAQAGASGAMATRVAWGSFERRVQMRLVSVPAPAGGLGKSVIPESGA